MILEMTGGLWGQRVIIFVGEYEYRQDFEANRVRQFPQGLRKVWLYSYIYIHIEYKILAIFFVNLPETTPWENIFSVNKTDWAELRSIIHKTVDTFLLLLDFEGNSLEAGHCLG